MKIWTDKEGNKLTIKEFLGRWKSGMQSVTALQLVNLNIVGFLFVFIGIIIGLIVTFNQTWWMFILLLGSFIITGVSFIGVLQKYIVLKDVERMMKGGQNEKE